MKKHDPRRNAKPVMRFWRVTIQNAEGHVVDAVEVYEENSELASREGWSLWALRRLPCDREGHSVEDVVPA